MSEFTFDLSSLSGITSATTSLETGLFSKTPDDKLTYSGKDPIVWDRTNNERLRRGLSPLPGTRPIDDGKTYGRFQGTPPASTAPNRPLTEEEKARAAAIAQQFGLPDPTAVAETFKVNGPPGMTREQAFDIFKKQADAGGLTGFSSGDILSAQTQAKDGLEEARAELAQARGGFPGTDTGVLNSFKSLADTAKQSIAAGTTGTSLSGAVGITGGIAKDTVGKIGALFGTPVTDGISTADFAKTASALVPMSNLKNIDVRATVASVGTATGQDFSQFTNAVGVGKFGFDATQLETAGLLKPGTASTYLAGGANQLTDVLKSPAVWTGKGGINNLDSLLSNPAAQSLTQQDLMSKGLGAAKSLGVPTDILNPKELGGISSVFSKDIAGGADWIRGQLPADKQADFDKRFADAKFAVGTAEQKLNDPVKQQAPPGESENTVNRQTVDAATTRVVGNDKVPSFNYGPQPANEALVAENKALRKEIKALLVRLTEIKVSEAPFDQLDAENAKLDALLAEFQIVLDKTSAIEARALNATPYSSEFSEKLRGQLIDIITAMRLANDLKKAIRQEKRQAQARQQA
jgi:hypothetical protein